MFNPIAVILDFTLVLEVSIVQQIMKLIGPQFILLFHFDLLIIFSISDTKILKYMCLTEKLCYLYEKDAQKGYKCYTYMINNIHLPKNPNKLVHI